MTALETQNPEPLHAAARALMATYPWPLLSLDEWLVEHDAELWEDDKAKGHQLLGAILECS